MAQNMKLSVVKETGENIIVTVNFNETFAEFQSRLFQENNLFVSVEDFHSLDENLTLDDNFFECLKKHLNDEDLLNFDGPLFEINLSKQQNQRDDELIFDINETPNYLDIVSQLKEIHNYTEENVADYCRLCANTLPTSNTKIMIFNNCFDEQINNYLPIKVHENDGLPQNMCEKCAINLATINDFTNRVIEAEKVLKLKFNNESFKTEVDGEEEYLEVEEIEEISNTQNHHCRICDLIIDNLKDALSHSAQDHRINNLYACVFCEYGFETTLVLSQHIQTEHKDFNKYICKVCGTRFAYQTMLQKHVCGTRRPVKELRKKNHENKCEMCCKIFADKQTLKEHFITHSEVKPFQCHVCGKHLNRLSRLKSHLLTHESDDLIVKQVNCCVDCKEGFENEHKAVLHQTVGHTIAQIQLNKVFRCEFCEKCFIDINALKNHRMVHTNDNPYICHICNAQFPSYSRCTSHKTSHGLFKEGGDKQIFPVIKYFLCNSCDNTYLNWTHLSSHKKLKHSNQNKSYNCLDCNIEFPNNYGLTYHRKTKHTEDPIKCSECGENLINYEAWKEHRLAVHANKKYNYQCVKCNKIFQSPENLEEHLKIHADLKENKCPYCPACFADVKDLGSHLKIHRIKKSHLTQSRQKLTAEMSNLRPYCCQDCGLTFRKRFTLKNHQLKHCIKLDKSKFVLMVDVAEDETNETVQKHETETLNNGQTNEQYIDLGNGNYVQVQAGNTVNIEGKDYVLVEENNYNQEITYLLTNNTNTDTIM